MTKPNINVTPLIDVLLVLLIIFMVIAPAKPTDFKTKIPSEPKENEIVETNPLTLVVSINSDSGVHLNRETTGTIQNTEKLIERLSAIFDERTKNGVYADGMENRRDLPESERIQKTVFIKAPRFIDYGEVVKVIDAVKISGANPIALQIDDLE